MARRALPFVVLVVAAAAALAVVPATASTAEQLVVHGQRATSGWTRAGDPCLQGTVEQCLAADGEGGGAAVLRRRRRLFQVVMGEDDVTGDYGGGAPQYISYAALMRNSVPCSLPGASYYNCRPGADANPYTRGCSAITQCRD
ncbi:protein RALF-like 22 [Oryza brachyantha]|uniref:protein RALF-like 22 n=1 Tax=Oryza brachyantha TaxID=4533 RepID=UPI001ADD3703|nr:protein RALF-like 22 [Oryza brachyantha]